MSSQEIIHHWGEIEGKITNSDITQSTSTTSGSAIFDGGVAVKKNIYVGESLNAVTITDGTSTLSNGLLTDAGIVNTTGNLLINNNSATGQTILQLGSDTNSTSMQVQNNSQGVLLKMGGNSVLDFYGNMKFDKATTTQNIDKANGGDLNIVNSGGELVNVEDFSFSSSLMETPGDTVIKTGGKLTLDSIGQVISSNSTQSTSDITGSITTPGGIGVSRNAFIGEDLYYNGLLAPTVKHLRNGMSTGLISGGIITIASATTINISSGSGLIVNNHTNPNLPTETIVTWNALLGVTVTNLANLFNQVFINAAGNVIFGLEQRPTPLQRRTLIYLGKIFHLDGVNVTIVSNQPDVMLSPANQTHDFWKAIGPIVIAGGLRVRANGANLSIDRTAGDMHQSGIGFNFITASPNIKTLTIDTLATFSRVKRDAIVLAAQTTIDPLNYDLGGVITLIPGSTNRATNQRVYLFNTGTIYIQYGQQYYTSINEARAAIALETYVTNPFPESNGVLIGIISVRAGATDLSLLTDAVISNASKFGEIAVGAAGTQSTNLQSAYNNSVSPEIVLNSTNGTLSIQDANPTISNILFEVLDTAGTRKFSVNSGGSVQIPSLLTDGISGTSSSLDFNLVPSKTSGNIIIGDGLTTGNVNIAAGSSRANLAEINIGSWVTGTTMDLKSDDITIIASNDTVLTGTNNISIDSSTETSINSTALTSVSGGTVNINSSGAMDITVDAIGNSDLTIGALGSTSTTFLGADTTAGITRLHSYQTSGGLVIANNQTSGTISFAGAANRSGALNVGGSTANFLFNTRSGTMNLQTIVGDIDIISAADINLTSSGDMELKTTTALSTLYVGGQTTDNAIRIGYGNRTTNVGIGTPLTSGRVYIGGSNMTTDSLIQLGGSGADHQLNSRAKYHVMQSLAGDFSIDAFGAGSDINLSPEGTVNLGNPAKGNNDTVFITNDTSHFIQVTSTASSNYNRIQSHGIPGQTNRFIIQALDDGPLELTTDSGSVVKVTNSDDTTSSTTGSLITNGGVGIAKSLYVGDELNMTSYGTVGQGTNITTGVTLNNRSGSVTLSTTGTIGIGNSAIFTVTNSTVNNASMIFFTYVGTNKMTVNTNAISAGSFQIILVNVDDAILSFTGVHEVQFMVIN